MTARRAAAMTALLATLLVTESCGGGRPPTLAPRTVATTLAPTPTPLQIDGTHPGATVAPTASALEATPAASPDWEVAVRLGEPDASEVAHAVASTGDRHLAIGARYESAHGGPSITARWLWTSTDGRSWNDLPPPRALDAAITVLSTPDRTFVAYANTTDERGSTAIRPVVARSADGLAWAEAESGLPDDLLLAAVVRGARGYLLLGRGAAGGSHSLWLSSDGLEWERVHELADTPGGTYHDVHSVGAGDEGFVVLGARARAGADGQRFTLASSDGRDWTERMQPFGTDPASFLPAAVVAPVDAGWVAALGQEDFSFVVYSSANGLDWDETALIEDETIERLGAAPTMSVARGRVVLSPTGRVPYGGAGSWTSTDGRSWERLVLAGDQDLTVEAAAVAEGLTILAGAVFARGGQTDAAIWIGPTAE